MSNGFIMSLIDLRKVFNKFYNEKNIIFLELRFY